MSQELALLLLGHSPPSGIFIDGFTADSPDFRVACSRMYEYEAADGLIRHHRTAVEQGYTESVPIRKQTQDVPLEGMVRAAGIACGRF